MNNFFDNQRILTLIWKRKFHFVIIGIIAIILAAIFSGPTFIKPMFKSVARVYPTNIGTISEESETEQMLEVMNSNDIKLRMFDAFELGTVYKIPKEDPHYLSYMFDIYNKYVKTSKTEYETVEISVMDYQPERAKVMCDSIIHFYNQKVGSMHKAKSWEMVQISQKLLDIKHREFDSLKVQLNNIREESGIFNFTEQSPEITRGYMTALNTGKASTTDGKKIEKLYNNFAEKGSDITWLEKQNRKTVRQIDSLAYLHEVYLMEYEKDITYSHIVEHPIVADKKSYPVRWLIVAFSAFSAVFFALLVFLVLDYQKEN
ncbi:MAG: hypothetical protein JXR61_06850 [Prolixibacteraceae bacterium]|nr:hypothetical protein [Prolixibacteraceae bacterium]